MDQKVIIRC